jgi:predicted dehydrogenase
VVEPRAASRETGKSRFEEAAGANPGCRASLEWHEGLSTLPAGGSDLSIIATDAAARGAIAVALARSGHRALLLEKPVCQSEAEYDSIIDACASSACRAWVNTIRRYSGHYRSCAADFSAGRFTLDVSGPAFGLGSNAIHYLDLFMMLGGGDPTVSSAEFSPRLYPSKRGEAFVELEGKMKGRDGAGNTFSISSLEAEPAEVTVIVTNDRCTFTVNESSRKAVKLNAGLKEDCVYEEPMVSRCTTRVAGDIFATGECLLPSLASLKSSHAELFRVVREHLAAVRGAAAERVPIT